MRATDSESTDCFILLCNLVWMNRILTGKFRANFIALGDQQECCGPECNALIPPLIISSGVQIDLHE